MGVLPEGFVYLQDVCPQILQDVKYATNDNFLGRVVAGYEKNIVICTEIAAQKLALVSSELKPLGYGLKVFDAYRPHRAVDDFWQWAHDDSDTLMKELYYPSFTKKADLFDGYLARYSAHSRGSTIDLTLVDLSTMQDVDMGTRFDFLGEESHTLFEGIPFAARNMRLLLKDKMEKHGFENYRREWWHFSLQDEPFKRKPEDHFDFVIA